MVTVAVGGHYDFEAGKIFQFPRQNLTAISCAVCGDIFSSTEKRLNEMIEQSFIRFVI